MRLILTAALALAPATAPAATRSYTVTGFERIRLAAPYAVTVTVGPGGAVKADGATADLDRVRVAVQGRTLVISAERDSGAWRDSGPVRITVTTPALTAAQISGAGTVTVDRMRGDRVDLAIGGAGELRVAALVTQQLTLSMLGAGEMAVAGQALRGRVVVQGAGDVDAAALTVADADVAVSGAGNVTLAATRTAKVVSSGVGQVTIAGGARCTVQRTGLGQVDCGR